MSAKAVTTMIDACAYNISPTAGSSAGVKHSDEAKANISESMKGNTNRKGREASEETKVKMSAAKKGRQGAKTPRYNSGIPVFLYSVRAPGLVLIASFPNKIRAAEHLKLSSTTVLNYINDRTLFEVNGSAHILSRNGNLA